jgi:hypothetical protein
MSYDLYFTSPKISRGDFKTYFSQRGRYEVSEKQAIYQNQDTGVYFIFDYAADGSEHADGAVASFNLNYFRPHVFGLEAVMEVAAFVERFAFSIEDPQIDGMGDGPFTSEKFLSGWNRGNEFGYSSFLKEPSLEKLWKYPTEQIEAVWRWNWEKNGVQQTFGESLFVPRIMFLEVGDAPASMVVWPDAIPELIPDVEYVVVGRDELAPRSFWRGRKKDQIILSMDQLRPVLDQYRTQNYSMPAYLLSTDRSEELSNFVRSLQQTEPNITGQGIPIDRILNAEIIEKVSR